MLFEQRLHPASMLFAFGQTLKQFAVPGLLVLFGASRRAEGPEVWLMLLLVPGAMLAIARYLSFRIRYEETELVIRSGIVFRNERHIPYGRIQNLDAVRNVLHRLLGVAEVRLETGAGKEPEATISVLPIAAVDEMRRRLFEGRPAAGVPAAAPAPAVRTLLQLPLRELLLFGLLESRGFVVIGAAFGLLVETGLLETLADRVFGDGSFGSAVVRDTVGALSRGERLPAARFVAGLAGILALVAVVELVSMGWAAVRLYGFRLTRTGEDLRAEYGLLTRIAATIPQQRVQTLTIREGPVQRWLGRVSVRVETAGGPGAGAGRSEREWLAPILRVTAAGELVRQVLPGFELDGVSWQPVHPRAFGRAARRAVLRALLVSAASVFVVGAWALVVLAGGLPMAIVSARRYVDRLGWTADEEVVVFRSGWLWRNLSVARVAKIQAVALVQSPFDRRAAMARVRVDTAGAGAASHRVNIPYLPREVARSLHQRLAALAAGTSFRW